MNTIIFCNGKSSWRFWRLSIFMVLKESCPCVRETFCTILKMITKNFFGEPTQNTNHDIWWNVMDCTQFSQLLFLIILFRCSYFCIEYHSPVRVFLVNNCVGKKLEFRISWPLVSKSLILTVCLSVCFSVCPQLFLYYI